MKLSLDNYRLKPNHVLVKKVRPSAGSIINPNTGVDDKKVLAGETPIGEVMVIGPYLEEDGSEKWLSAAVGKRFLLHAVQGRVFPVRLDGLTTEFCIFHNSAMVAEVVDHDEWEDVV